LLLAACVLASPRVLRAEAPAHAQDKTKATAECPPEETRSEVPALTEFHHSIAKLWHEAWPNKQMDVMRSMLPELQAGAAKVAEATLPGILHEKQAEWDAGVKQMQAAMADYATAVAGSDDQKLLDAAEALHSKFEGLVRATRPALKELDAFHAVLYKLYHYEMPANDRAAIRTSVANLKQPMAALNKAVLPERLKAKQKDFVSNRKLLTVAVDRLAVTVRSNDDARIKQAVEDMHSRYQALSAVFE
jgi:hypothetical protein